MNISSVHLAEQPKLSAWAPTIRTHTIGAISYREGVYHSPSGSVECFSQQALASDATPPATFEGHVTSDAPFTQLRMVLGGIGWEYRDAHYYEADRLIRLASAFARLVASAHAERLSDAEVSLQSGDKIKAAFAELSTTTP